MTLRYTQRVDDTLLMGAVAYDAKVVTIWERFREYFQQRGFDFDFVLYSNYERQVGSHLAGHIDVAWNSPLAWLQAKAGAERQERRAEAICMRDTDRDLASVIIVRDSAPVDSLEGLAGKRIGLGAKDSPQANLIPLHHLAEAGLHDGAEIQTVAFDLLVGKHGDHIGGEREAARALLRDEVDAACIIDGNYLAFTQEGTLSPGSARVVSRTATTATTTLRRTARFNFEMSYAIRPPAGRKATQLPGAPAAMRGRRGGPLRLHRRLCGQNPSLPSRLGWELLD